MSCCPLNAYYLAVAVLSAVQCPLLKTVGSPLLDGLAGGVCALLGGSGAVTNACNCLTAANAPGACGSRCTDSQGIGPGYALYTPLSSILGSVAKLAGESVCPGTTGYYCPTGQTCKTRTGSAPYCCNDSTDCYSSLGKCADTSWQQYRVTIGASTSNFCCGNGTIGVYQSTGQNSVGICATARPAFYTTVSAISSGSCSYSTSSIVLSITLSSNISTRSGSSSSQTSTLVPDSPITFTRSRSTSTSTSTSIRASSSSSSTTQSKSTSTSISTSPRPSSTLVPDSLITFTRSKSTSTSVSILLSPTSSSTTQSLTSPISSVSSSNSISKSKSTSTTQIIQSPTFSSSTISSSTSSIVISISTSVSDNLSSTSLTFTATSPSSSAFNQSPPSVSQSNTSIPSSSSSISSLEISQSQSQLQSQSSSIHFTFSPSQSSSSVSNFISSSFIGPVTAQSSTLSEAESTNSTSTSAPVETPAEPCDASMCLFSRVIPTSREL